MQDCFNKTHLDARTSNDSRIATVAFVDENVARFYRFMDLNNKVYINATDCTARVQSVGAVRAVPKMILFAFVAL